MESTNEKPDKQLTGLCGEHYVSALLAGYGLVVALPRGGAARSDLFVGGSKRGRALRVQVKTARDPFGADKANGAFCSWETDCGIIDTHDESLWYAFVALRNWPNEPNPPEVLFVPSATVATRMETEKGRSRTFYWITVSDADEFRDKKGVDLLKAAIASPSAGPGRLD